MLSTLPILAGLLAMTSASPIATPVETPATPAAHGQARSLCSQYATYSAFDYIINNNVWGKGSATSGNQCSAVNLVTASTAQWSTEWVWDGGKDNVKSYANCGKTFAKGLKISNIKSMPTKIQWNYTPADKVRANVAYDVFTAKDPNHDTSSGDYELMIWLARLGGVYPIGSKVATATVAGKTWDLYSGLNGSMRVFSFLPANGLVHNSFDADVKDFYKYLTSNQNFPASEQNLIVLQQGTEAFTGGAAKFTVTDYNVSVNV